ncbi:MAG: tetratricopeptide repeat protein [Betaproteobacteria bacterium]|nr:tetratricopeptide repeat protein [Betaproteobacteria bacterium]
MQVVIQGKKAEHASKLIQQGLQLILQGRYQEALTSEDEALKILPMNANAHSYRGSALLQLGRISEALASYDQVIKLAPLAAVAHYNRANALQRMRRYEDALLSLEKSLKLDPSYTDALSLTGSVFYAMGNIGSAIQYFDAALKINPNAADAHYNKSLALLSEGKFSTAWEHYEWRLRWDMTVRVGQSRSIGRVAPDWDGRPQNKPIIVIPEQGLGDQIFYGGMLADLESVVPGSTVCLEPRLVPLFQRSFKNLNFSSPYEINADQCLKDLTFSAQTHIGSLGKFFRANTSGFARVRTPYLRADPAKVNQLQRHIRKPNRIVCGISWLSKNKNIGSDKSISLETLLPLLSIDNIDFVDLQYGDTTDERRQLARTHGIHVQHLSEVDNSNDIDTLAALISACDIVVTISNVTAHIASAIGKPTLVMLPNLGTPLWYWHKSHTDSIWYPNSVLLHQSKAGAWADVISSVRTAVTEFKRVYQQ